MFSGPRSRILLVCLCALFVACDKNANPIAPSLSPASGLTLPASAPATHSQPAPDASTPPQGTTQPSYARGATISGLVNGVNPTFQSMASQSSSRVTGQSSSMTVTATTSGFLAATEVDAQGRFTLTGIPVGSVFLRFTAPDVDATATIADIGPSERIEIDVTVSRERATIDSIQRSEDSQIELQGGISFIDLPARRLDVSDTEVHVPPQTLIKLGSGTLGIADLRVGDIVLVNGATEGDRVTASRIEVVSQAPPPATEVVLHGDVHDLAADCPHPSFRLDGKKVVTDRETTFTGGTCDDIVDAARVEVHGLLQRDETVLATTIEIEAPPPPIEVVLHGDVHDLAADCPHPSFRLDGKKVVTDRETTFTGGTCDDIVDAARVEVHGLLQRDETVLATTIEIEAPPPPIEVVLHGDVHDLAADCPHPSFRLDGKKVVTDRETTFTGGTCEDIVDAARVEVHGLLQRDETVLATTIEIEAPPPPIEVMLHGDVHDLAADCPHPSFRLDGKKVVTDRETTFTGGTCEDIVDAARVEVHGLLQRDETVLATTIEIEAPPPPIEVVLHGDVHDLAADCPHPSFRLDGKKVVTDRETTFTGGTCEDIVDAARVEVHGLLQRDETMLATSVTIKAEPK